jgi:flavodoxin
MKTLIAYFSASGITKKVAENLAFVAGADLFEIAPPVPYTAADLDWRNDKSRSSVEMKDPVSRPEFVGKVENMTDYDTVFVGFPVWWYVEPRIIDTFLEAYGFAGKTMVAFATSGSSGISGCDEHLRGVCPNANWKPGKILNGNPDLSALREWARSL